MNQEICLIVLKNYLREENVNQVVDESKNWNEVHSALETNWCRY